MVDDNKQMLTRRYVSPHRVSTPPPPRGPVSVGGCSFAVSVCFQLKFFFFGRLSAAKTLRHVSNLRPGVQMRPAM